MFFVSANSGSCPERINVMSIEELGIEQINSKSVLK